MSEDDQPEKVPPATAVEDDEPEVELAIYNRPKRVCKPVVDYLVSQHNTVKRLYQGKAVSRSKRPRSEEADSSSSGPVTPTVTKEPDFPPPCTPPPPPKRKTVTSTPPPPSTPPRTPPPQHVATPQQTTTPSPDIIQVHLTTLSNRQALVKIFCQRTLDDLLQRVETVLGLSKDQVVVKWKGRDIRKDQHNRTLHEIGIQDGDALVLRVVASSTTEAGAGSSSPFRATVRLPVSPYKELPPWLKR